MDYEHTQHAPMGRFLAAIGFVCCIGAGVAHQEPVALIALAGTASLLFAIAGMFNHLTVRDEGDRLDVRFGPIPLFGRSVRYDEISEVEQDRTTWIDGWGIHGAPGRGWTWNIWGFDCVRLTVAGRTLRIGSDDAEKLAAFLRERIARG